MHSVLIVDDDSKSIQELGNILQPYYNVKAANSAENAFKVLDKFYDIELILLDVVMPFVTGYEMLELLKNNNKFKHIPVILISGLDEVVDEYRGLGIGAVDYIQKPILPSVLLARINIHVNISLERKNLLKQIDILKTGINVQKDSYRDIIYEAILYLTNKINPISLNIDSKSQEYLRIIATELFKKKVYTFDLSKEIINDMCLSVPLHDIGLIGIHDTVLLKEGKYTPDDFVCMKEHTLLGYESLEYAIEKLKIKQNDIGYIRHAIEMAHYHHEWWDGTGYPEGLKGYEIPLSARLMSVVDVFDALLSERSYRKKFDFDEAVNIIINGGGTHFDPKIIIAFKECIPMLKNISEE